MLSDNGSGNIKLDGIDNITDDNNDTGDNVNYDLSGISKDTTDEEKDKKDKIKEANANGMGLNWSLIYSKEDVMCNTNDRKRYIPSAASAAE